MKNRKYIYIILILIVSCNDSNKKETENTVEQQTELNVNKVSLDLEKNSNLKLSEWIDYYQSLEPNFSLENFEFKSKDSLNIIQGNVFGNYDTNFDPIYSDFLIYRNDKEKYIDFDSYNWSIDENKEILFSPDQEINVVDIKNKTVDRIAFRGPSQWVENAYWESDSMIVLLENNYEKQPIITELNLKSKTVKSFKYRDTLNFDSEYSKLRFKEKGLKYE
jgi:hypothetical protein